MLIDKAISIINNKPSPDSFQEESKLGGWCDPNLMSILNNLATNCLEKNEKYLEIGTFVGRSLVATLKNNEAEAIVVDPFIDGEHVYREWERNILNANISSRITLYKQSCESVNFLNHKIGLFLYDGSHDSGHTYEGLKKFSKYLSSSAIIVVDDLYIYGGHQQNVFPGHKLDVERPVMTDVTKWLSENTNAQCLTITPYCHGQMFILYKGS